MKFRKTTIKHGKKTTLVYGQNVTALDSPIAPLLGNIVNSPNVVVPERYEEYQLFVKKGISVEINAQRGDFHITAELKEKKIILGKAALERVWAYTYFYLSVLDLIGKHKLGKSFDLRTIAEIADARALAIWAYKSELGRKMNRWPEDLPRPDSSDKKICRTNEAFIYAVGFMVLHEMAHIEKNHYVNKYETKAESYAIEFAADEWAADYMFGKVRESGITEDKVLKRIAGGALGIANLLGVEIYHRSLRDDHPNVAERLLKFFEKFDDETQGIHFEKAPAAKYIGIAIIQGHFLNAGVTFDYTEQFDEISDFLIKAHKALENHKANKV